MANIYVITGPSGVGKTTVAYELLKRCPTLKKVVTCTTRPIRPTEADGVDYHFLTTDTFKELIAQEKLFESAYHYGNFYGSRTQDVQALIKSGNDVLFVVDVVGAQSIKRDHPEAVVIFIAPKSPDELMARIARRDHGKTAELEERRAAIGRELAWANKSDHVVTNSEGKLDETVAAIERIMQ